MTDAIIHDSAEDSCGQPLAGTNGGKLSLFPSPESVVGGADPECAIGLSVEGLDKIAVQPVGFAELSQLPILEAGEAAAHHAKPQGAVRRLCNRSDIGQCEGFLAGEPEELAILVAVNSEGGADPDFAHLAFK